MKPNEFDNLAVRAVRQLDEPNERVWAASRPQKRDWFPSWREIGMATAVGGVALLCLASIGDRQAEIPRTMMVRAQTHERVSSFQSSFASVNRLAGVPASLFGMR